MKWKLLLLIFILPILAFAQISGCTDAQARNFNPNATINDGSCKYNSAKIKPKQSFDLNSSIKETSGLLFWNNQLWTINDDSDTNLYTIDSLGFNLQKLTLPKVKNKDWEAIAQDSLHIYIGDFGNNVSGNRKDLHILKIDKRGLSEKTFSIDTISFSFDNQTHFENQKVNTTNFDCETILVTRDSLFLVTKEWKSKKTRLYALPKTSGTHLAKFRAELNVKGLIADGTLLEDQKVMVLCGYSKKLQPFLYLLFDFQENDFFSGNKRKIKLKLPFHQIEGIATKDGLLYYLTNENFQKKPVISVMQKLHLVDLSSFLAPYLAKLKD